MTISPISTIALVTCDENSKVNFAHVVGEMRRSLDKSTRSRYTLTWDHDDIAAFDFESTRIVLSLAEQTMPEVGPDTDHLFISVGAPFEGNRRRDPAVAHEQLCSTIVERVCAYYETKSVYWQQVDECITSETVDQTFERIAVARHRPKAMNIEAEEAMILEPTQPPEANIVQLSAFPSRSTHCQPALKARQAPEGAAANDMIVGHYDDTDRLSAIRSALYDAPEGPVSGEDEKKSPIVRITATALDTTMIIVCLPVGAAMLTYHVFRGGELRRTAHMMTLTGLLMTSSKAVAAMQITNLLS